MPDSFDLDHATPDSRTEAPWLEQLNPEQRKAVEATEGPVLVLAGAGTGKTRVLTTRLAHILATGLAHPGQVLAVTFTNRAAREMKERVQTLVERPVDGWHLGTFHSVAARILRRHAERVGLAPNFTIVDTDDQLRIIKQILAANHVDPKKWPPRAVLTAIQRWKDRGLLPDKVSAEDGTEIANGKAITVYREYQQRLLTSNAADFGDLLLHCITLFTENDDVLEEYRDRFHYILVDEYQDTNVTQYLWLRLLAQKHRNICCVGDDDQSIYAWRGAEIGNILRFETDFSGARVIRLERNYRSTGHILGAAGGVIAHNDGRLGKTLWTEGEAGEAVRVIAAWDGDDEARTVAHEIETLRRQGNTLGGMAILVRAAFQTRSFEECFLQIGLPYRMLGGVRFYERLEIRDALAYLRLVAQPDDDLALERIINTPRRGIGATSLGQIHQHARAQELPLLSAARELVETSELRGRAGKSVTELIASLDRWRERVDTLALPDLAALVLDESGYTEMWKRDRSLEAPGRLENLEELIGALEEFDTLAGFLEHVSLVMDTAAGEQDDTVNIMTVHAAKGLEFDTVFLPGWEEGIFPNRRSLEERGEKSLEEERRLAYVALTRARRRAFVLHAGVRQTFGRSDSNPPSRFIAELPEAHIEYRRKALSTRNRSPGAAKIAVAAPSPRRSPAPRRAAAPARSAGGIPVGRRVFHRAFGYGRVEKVDGDKLEIAFEKPGAGTKKVVESFVTPA